MNVYDFDNTILRGDTTARFFVYCLARTPKMWLHAPMQIVNAAMFLLKLRPKQQFKQRMLSFLQDLQDVDAVLERFWDANQSRVKQWYLDAQKDDDVIISASPEFMLRPICMRLGINNLMGSPVDSKTGVFFGQNCHGQEKVRRFREVYPQAQIDDFYSDSYSDSPLARIANRAFLVKGDELLSWDKK